MGAACGCLDEDDHELNNRSPAKVLVSTKQCTQCCRDGMPIEMVPVENDSSFDGSEACSHYSDGSTQRTKLISAADGQPVTAASASCPLPQPVGLPAYAPPEAPGGLVAMSYRPPEIAYQPPGAWSASYVPASYVPVTASYAPPPMQPYPGIDAAAAGRRPQPLGPLPGMHGAPSRAPSIGNSTTSMGQGTPSAQSQPLSPTRVASARNTTPKAFAREPARMPVPAAEQQSAPPLHLQAVRFDNRLGEEPQQKGASVSSWPKNGSSVSSCPPMNTVTIPMIMVDD